MLYSYDGRNIAYSDNPHILFNIIGCNIQYFIKLTDRTGKCDYYVISNTDNFYFDYSNPDISKYTFKRLSKNSNYNLQYAQNDKGIYIILNRTNNYLIEVWEYGSFNNTIDFTSEGTLDANISPIDFDDSYQYVDYNNTDKVLYPVTYNNIKIITDKSEQYVKLASISKNLTRFMELKVNLNALTDLYNIVLNVRNSSLNEPVFAIECNTNSTKTDKIKIGYIKNANTIDIYLYIGTAWSTVTLIDTDFNQPKLEIVDINNEDIIYENILYNVDDITSIADNNNSIKNKIVCDSNTNRIYNVQGNNIYDALGYDISINKKGTTEQRPNFDNYAYIGFEYFDTTLNKPIWWIGTKWVDSEGNDADSTPITSGTFANKPTGVDIGYAYFCTDKQTTEGSTNGIMIYYKGSNTWVDALGRVVS